jgi:leucyl/phenylalanyl-tRNA--protein transferase
MIPSDLLLRAYGAGLFPMGMEEGHIGWFSPDPRGVIPLDALHVPRRLARVVRQGRFDVSVNLAFDEVIDACARPGAVGTWITDEIRASYCELHRRGFAHSMEVRLDRVLVGGLYGVALGAAFFGESMFSRATDASKVALVALVDRLVARGYRLLDVQWVTPHLERFGAVEISGLDYQRRLTEALAVECDFTV